ncbi:RNA polymerase sigma factor RpoD/SigA [Patescibacteria group bacterium]
MGASNTDQHQADEAFIRSLNRYVRITKEEEYALIVRAQNGDEAAVCRLIEQHNRQILKIAKRFRGRGLMLWDLFSEGRIGLLKAIEKFDVEKGFRLSTYATWWIRQAMTRAMQDQGKTVRIPVHAQEFFAKVVRAIRILRQKSSPGESPSDEAVIDWMFRYCNIPTEDDEGRQRLIGKVHAMRSSPAFMSVASLEAPVDAEEHTQLKDLIPEKVEPDGIEALLEGEHRDTIGTMIDRLRPREKYVIHFRFFREWTLDDVAKTMVNRSTGKKITRERVRQIELVAIKKLRYMLQKYRLPKWK